MSLKIMSSTSLEILATCLFALAVVHTFMIKGFNHLAVPSPPNTGRANLLRLMGEIEIVSGIWTGLLTAFPDNAAITFLGAQLPNERKSKRVTMRPRGIAFGFRAAHLHPVRAIPQLHFWLKGAQYD
jgi:hypothetical protein